MSQRPHPCDIVLVDNYNVTETTITFRANIANGYRCKYWIRVTPSGKQSFQFRMKGNEGQVDVPIEGLAPGTRYRIEILNSFTMNPIKIMDRKNTIFDFINGQTKPLVTSLKMYPFQFSAYGELAFPNPSLANSRIGTFRVQLQKTDKSTTGRAFLIPYRDLVIKQNRIQFPIRSLDTDTNYDISIDVSGNSIGLIQHNTTFRTRQARCTFYEDKIGVVSNRMSFKLDFTKMNHLLKKIFHKIALYYIKQSDPSIFTENNQKKINTLSSSLNPLMSIGKSEGRGFTKNENKQFATAKAEKQALIQKYKTTKERKRSEIYQKAFEDVRNFFTTHPEFVLKRDGTQGNPTDPLHIELFHLLLANPENRDGNSARFIARFFPGMSVSDRRRYFEDGFPGGSNAFVSFVTTLLDKDNQDDIQYLDSWVRVDTEGNVLQQYHTEKEANDDTSTDGKVQFEVPLKRRTPTLRFIFRGSNISDPDGHFGYIFLSNKAGGEESKDKDDILVHLSIAEAMVQDSKDLFRIAGTPLTYHITDICFDHRNYYRFEDDRPVTQTGDRSQITENKDGSVTFVHKDPGVSSPTIKLTVSLDVHGNVIHQEINNNTEGGMRKTRKAKINKKRKTMRGRRG